MELRCFFGSYLLILPVFFVCLVPLTTSYPQLREIYSWKSLDFAFSSTAERDSAIRNGHFIPGAPVPIDVDVYTEGTSRPVVFITIPRFQDGVPLTVGYVTNVTNSEGNPIIAPYPNWQMQRSSGNDCTGFTSVYRIHIDSCKRIWILDTGKLGELRVCPPQLHVYSLKTNQLLRRHVFPQNQYMDSSLFVTPVVDIRDSNGSCDDTYVYIADVTGFGMIVYDYRNFRSWRIVNNLFYPYPQYGTFTINNESFDLMDGILGLALGPIRQDGDRILYFHSLASRTESWVPTSIIRNFTTFEHSPESSARSFKPFARERTSQSAAQVMDKNGVLFFGLMSDVAIGCWNSRDYQEFGGNNVVNIVTNSQTLQFASGMKIVTPSHSNRPELWVITVSFQKIMTGSLRPTETNFRIQAAYIDELVRGTKCEIAPDGVNNVHRRAVNRQVPSDGYNYRYNYLEK